MKALHCRFAQSQRVLLTTNVHCVLVVLLLTDIASIADYTTCVSLYFSLQIFICVNVVLLLRINKIHLGFLIYILGSLVF